MLVVVIRGPMASGKSTIAHALAGRIGGVVVSIDRILEERGLEEWEEGRRPGTRHITERAFLRANDWVVDEADRHRAEGRSSIIDGNFYWRSVLEDLLERILVRREVFTLTLPLSVCVERNARRVRPIGDASDVQMVYDKVTEFEAGRPVDASGTPEEVLSVILAQIDHGTRQA